jgi:hypothetical protein
MTALAKPARPEQGDDALRPVPWQRMAGITWRQHRFALAGVAGLLGALAVWLWIIGTSLHQAYAAAVACRPANSGACKGGKPSFGTFAQCLAPHGYRMWTSYQPASRFWPFQWIEGGWLLALSALLIAATIWLVHRCAA